MVQPKKHKMDAEKLRQARAQRPGAFQCMYVIKCN